MSYYPELDSHIRYKIKVVLKGDVDKLGITKLVNVPASMNNLKTRVDDLYVGKLKTVLVDLKKLSDIVDNEVVKIKNFNTFQTKLIRLDKKIVDATTLIHINQYNTDKQKLEK